MIDFEHFYRRLEAHNLDQYHDHFREAIAKGLSTERHGHLNAWLNALDSLPPITELNIELRNSVSISNKNPIPTEQLETIEDALKALIPWRKGPFDVLGIHIDTEWRSNWKWQRVVSHLTPLAGRRVLDIGCGSGYHCWRMLGEGADWVIGIDPSPRFVAQFAMIKHFIGDVSADVLPLGIEHMPAQMNCFDTVFSMGVFYHRISPMEHLKELKNTLRPGGELVLETLVIRGEPGQVLVPEDRYAMMRNVWFIPSVPSMIAWLKKCGFENVRCVNQNQTSLEEQRSTAWMPSHSLREFLDPDDINLTAEGYPAPLRAVFIANKST